MQVQPPHGEEGSLQTVEERSSLLNVEAARLTFRLFEAGRHHTRRSSDLCSHSQVYKLRIRQLLIVTVLERTSVNATLKAVPCL